MMNVTKDIRILGVAACALAMLLASQPAVAAFMPVPDPVRKAFKSAKGKECKSGWVFVNGKYVQPPYVVERYGTVIRINGEQVTQPLVPWEKLVMTQPESSRVTVVEDDAPEPAAEPAPAKEDGKKEDEAKAEEKGDDEKKGEDGKPKDKDDDDDEELEASNSTKLRIVPFLVGAAKDERDPLDRLFDDDEPEEKPEKKSKKEVEEDSDEEDGDSDEEAEKPPKKSGSRKNADKPAAKAEASEAPKAEAKDEGGVRESEKPAAKPKRSARKPAERVALKEGVAFEMNDEAKAIKAQLNAVRTEINTVLLTDGYVFFGERHPPVLVQGREAKALRNVLPSALKDNAKNARGLLSALHGAGVVSVTEPVARELARHYIGYIQIQQRMEPDADMRRIKSKLKGK